MEEKISVIIPVYKVENYLDRCVTSVVNQTYKNLEIILIDDGSPDNSGKMCDDWAKKDNRIKVIHKQNGGLPSARNVGLKIASGEYIAYIDSDDYIHPEMYSTLLQNALENDSDIVFCGIIKKYSNGKEIKIEETNLQELENKNFEPFFYLDGDEDKTSKIFCSVWRSLFKFSTIKNITFDEKLKYSEDMPYMVEVLSLSKKITVVDKHFYYYFHNDNSITNQVNDEKLLEKLSFHHTKMLNLIQKLGLNYAKTFLNYGFLLRFTMFSLNKKDFTKIIKKAIKENKDFAQCFNKQDYKVIKTLDIKKSSKIRNYLIYHKNWFLLKLLYKIK